MPVSGANTIRRKKLPDRHKRRPKSRGQRATAATPMPDESERLGRPFAPEHRSMTTPLSEKRTLLEELDTRQDEVLEQLDALNERIEALLKECLGDRCETGPDPAPAA